jgi:hypothetical protein
MFFFLSVDSLNGSRRPHCSDFEIPLRHTTSGYEDSSRGVIGSIQRPMPDNTQHSHDRDIHAVGGIRCRKPRRRASEDPSLRPPSAFTQLPHFARVSYHNTFKDLIVKCVSIGPVSVVRDSAMLLLVTVRNEKFLGQGVKQWHNI